MLKLTASDNLILDKPGNTETWGLSNEARRDYGKVKANETETPQESVRCVHLCLGPQSK